MYDNCASGNVSYGKPRHNAPQPQRVPLDKRERVVAVQVQTATRGGLVVPVAVKWETGKVYKIDRVHGTRRDPVTGDVEIGIRIGKRTTRIWRRADGSYYVVAHK